MKFLGSLDHHLQISSKELSVSANCLGQLFFQFLYEVLRSATWRVLEFAIRVVQVGGFQLTDFSGSTGTCIHFLGTYMFYF